MCERTKQRIAECVKKMAGCEPVNKITISDIMMEMNMSRQCFYYYFRDIYEVLEWIGQEELGKQISEESCQSVETEQSRLLSGIFTFLSQNKRFSERIVAEIAWPKIVFCVRGQVVKRLNEMIWKNEIQNLHFRTMEQKKYTDFVAGLICYSFLDYVYQKGSVTKEMQECRIQMLVSNLQRTVRDEKTGNAI